MKFVIRVASGELVQGADGDVAKYYTRRDAEVAMAYIKTPCTVEPWAPPADEAAPAPAWLGTIERALSGQQVTEDEAVAATEAIGAAADVLEAVGERPTLRDQLAMAALTGLLANQGANAAYHGNVTHAAVDAYQVADAMLEARAKRS